MRKLAVTLSLLAGVVAIVLAITFHATSPIHNVHGWVTSWKWLDDTKIFSVSGALGGMGIIMIIGGLLIVRWEAVGGIVTILAAIYGLAFVLTHFDPNRIPLLYWWAAPMVLAWLAGICASYVLYDNTAPYGSPERPIEAPRP